MSAFGRWCVAWTEIASGIVGVLTLGHYLPSWDVAVAGWATVRHAKSRGRK